MTREDPHSSIKPWLYFLNINQSSATRTSASKLPFSVFTGAQCAAQLITYTGRDESPTPFMRAILRSLVLLAECARLTEFGILLRQRDKVMIK